MEKENLGHEAPKDIIELINKQKEEDFEKGASNIEERQVNFDRQFQETKKSLDSLKGSIEEQIRDAIINYRHNITIEGIENNPTEARMRAVTEWVQENYGNTIT